jgi:hypothetical protein
MASSRLPNDLIRSEQVLDCMSFRSYLALFLFAFSNTVFSKSFFFVLLGLHGGTG